MKSRTAAATSSGCSCRSMWLPPLISRTSRLGNPFERSAVPSAEVTMLSAPRRTNAAIDSAESFDHEGPEPLIRDGGIDAAKSPERVVDSGEGATHRCDTLVDEGVGHGCGNRSPRVRDEACRRERTRRVGEDG